MLRNTYKTISRQKDEQWTNEFISIMGDILTYNFKFNSGDKFYNENIRKFIYCELLMYTAYLVYGDEFNLEQILILFSGVHNQFIKLSDDKEKIVIQANILLNSFMTTEQEKRNVILNFYFKLRYKQTTNISLFVLKNKSEIYGYEKIGLNKNIHDTKNRHEIYTSMLSDEKFIRLKETTNKKGILNEYIDFRIDEKRERGVIDIGNILNSVDDKFVMEMDKKSNNNYYLETYQKLNLIALREKDSAYTHIVGKTGHGKTVLLDIYINKLVSEGIKVLYITDTHNPNSINTKLRLDELGINTNIITGKDRNKYINSFIENNSKKSIPELVIKYSDLFDNLDSQCIGVNNNCKDCKISDCGNLNMFRRIEKSDVVITTPFNLIDSSASIKIDKYRRSISEICTLWADVIIWDEVDKLQIIGDDRLVSQVQAYSLESVDQSDNEHLEMFLKIINKEIKRKYIDDRETRLFKAMVRNYDYEADFFHDLFLRNDGNNLVRKLYGNRRFNINQLIEDFHKKYISTVNTIDGRKVEANRFIDRVYYTLKLNIEYIRTDLLKDLMSEYRESEDLDIKDIYEKIFNTTKNFISKYAYNEENIRRLELEESEAEVNEIKINFKIISNEEKEERSIFLSFIVMIISIEDYLQNIYDKGQGFLETIENAHEYIKMKGNSNSHIMAPRPLINNSSGFSLKVESTKETKLIHNNYMAIGREVLFNNSRYLSILYGIPQVYNIYTSATSTGTDSSKYDFNLPPDTLLKRKDTESSEVKVECHMFYDNDIPIKISGEDYRLLGSLVRKLSNKIAMDIIKPIINNKNSGVLISTSSYKNASIIADELFKMGIKVKVVYDSSMGEFNSDIHIKKLNIEKESIGLEALVGINTILERGLNMVMDNGESYFRDIILFNRSLPTPNDILEEVSYIHKELYVSGQEYRKTKSEMYKLLRILRYKRGYTSMPQKIKKSIAGNTFVSMKQLIGRGQRGGTSVTLHLVDSAFYPYTAERGIFENVNKIIDTSKTSLFMGWLELVNEDSEIVDYLYDDIKMGLNNYKLIKHN